MLTGIFGSIHLQDNKTIPTFLQSKAKYGASHTVHLEDINYGHLGAVLIGEDKNESANLPLQKFEDLVACIDITLYNRKELKSKLDINNNPEDAELLLRAFRKWGVRCV